MQTLTKTLKLPLSLLASLTLLCSCASESPKASHKTIAPLPAAISAADLQECTVPATFKPEDFHWADSTLTMTIYTMDLYDAVEVAQMQVGDTIVYDGQPIVITTIDTEQPGGIVVNGGYEEGGCWLVGHEGGTYVTRVSDDHATYTELAEATVTLAQDFILIDCGSFPDDPNDTIRSNHQPYLDHLPDGRKDFHSLNTRVTFEGGQVKEIKRHWIP